MAIYKSICPYDCPTTCGLLVESDGARILKVKGDPADPVCKGLICRKMQRYEKSIHSPDRIMTPLKRTGEKGMVFSKQFRGTKPLKRSLENGSSP